MTSAVVTGTPRDVQTDGRHMHRAVELAGRGWGRVSPNPMVGAVVVDGAGRVVGEGWHAEYGGPHAEVLALDAAGPAAVGGALYVTLEPCAHHGRTPPCTDAVIRSGVSRVVIAVRDPNPVASGGIERLRAAGIEVVLGVGAQEAEDANAAFLHWHRTGTPWIALKYAMSLDGRLAEREGVATPITGAAARAETHRLRAGFDAILVGGRTARIDDPALTVRGSTTPRRAPVRLVLSVDLELPSTLRLVSDPAAPTWIITAEDARGDAGELEARGVRVLHVPRLGDGLDLHAAVRLLAEHDVRSVLCEGGGRLGSALLSAGAVSRQVLFIAPRFLGPAGPPAFLDGVDAMNAEWRTVRAERFGDDVLIEMARS